MKKATKPNSMPLKHYYPNWMKLFTRSEPITSLKSSIKLKKAAIEILENVRNGQKNAFHDKNFIPLVLSENTKVHKHLHVITEKDSFDNILDNEFLHEQCNNEKKVKSTKYAFFCEMVGNKNSFILQKSKQGNSEIDKAFQLAMQKFTNKKLRTGAFREIVASDEIVSNGPG